MTASLHLQLLDANADAEITQQEFTEALVRIFLVRKSLSLTLMVRAHLLLINRQLSFNCHCCV
jgi:hypothetical protein